MTFYRRIGYILGFLLLVVMVICIIPLAVFWLLLQRSFWISVRSLLRTIFHLIRIVQNLFIRQMIPPVEEIKEIRSNFERKMKEVNQLHLSKDKYILIQKNLSEYYQELDKILFYGTSPLYKLKRKREFKELKATLDKEFILWVESNDNISIENKSELKAFISKENSKNI